jgi:hypothetical protein
METMKRSDVNRALWVIAKYQCRLIKWTTVVEGGSKKSALLLVGGGSGYRSSGEVRPPVPSSILLRP